MPLARQTQRPASLAQMFGVEPEVGREPSSIAFNDYLANIEPTNEQRREGGVIDSAAARTDASMASDLAEAEAVREARNLGFEGSYPLQEQAQWSADQKLRQLLIPEQMKLESARTERETGREFDANQRAMDRSSREKIASGAQAGQTGRVQAQQQGIASRQQQAQQAKQGGISKLYNWLTGSGQAQANPAAPTQAPAASGDVTMIDPTTGETASVPAARVNEYLARGAQIVN